MGEHMIVLSTKSFHEYARYPWVKRLYLTYIGTDGKATIVAEGKEYAISEYQAFCIPQYERHRYYSSEEESRITL